MKIHYSEKPQDYDGSQLSSHWNYKTFGILGNSLVAFSGPCTVAIEKMVDLVDVIENKPIHSENMLHFIGEFFNGSLTETILRQRLFITLAQQEIIFRTKKYNIVRGGNDLYEDGAKLSVAIATASPISTLFHFGINISSKGTPVKTKGLDDYQIEPVDFARTVMESFKYELETIEEARSKVRAVS